MEKIENEFEVVCDCGKKHKLNLIIAEIEK